MTLSVWYHVTFVQINTTLLIKLAYRAVLHCASLEVKGLQHFIMRALTITTFFLFFKK
ncbi:hypothetical protein AB4K20DRAFT_1906520 [Rhizopus microsporus]